MRPLRPRHLTAALGLCALASPGVARAQVPCSPSIEIGPSVPSSVADRLRLIAPWPTAVDARCPSIRFSWSERRLVIDIALDDGRIAHRALRTLEDALPTVFAVLAAPDDPPWERSPSPPAQPLTPIAEPTPSGPRPALTAVDLEVPRPRLSPVVPPPSGAFRLNLGVGGGVQGRHPLALVQVETTYARRWAVIGLRAFYREEVERERSTRGDGGASEGGAALVLRARTTSGRWSLEGGLAAGALYFDAPARRGDPDDPTRDRSPVAAPGFAMTLGADLVGSYRLWRGLSVTSTLSGSRSLFGGDQQLSVTGALGLQWELR